MWWRWRSQGIGLALLLMMLGTPAREAEAASDLARTRAEIGTPGRFEETDGGVGDDQLEAPCPDDPDQVEARPLDQAGAALPAASVASWLTPRRAAARAAATARPPAAPLSIRLAWLQQFRF